MRNFSYKQLRLNSRKMATNFPQKEIQLIKKIQEQEGFKDLSAVPVLAWQQLILLILCPALLFGSGYLHFLGILPYPLVALIGGFSVYAAFTPLHDATHRSVSKLPWLNDLLGTISAQLILPGATTSVYRVLHLAHHAYTGDPKKDPDEITVSTPMPWRPFLLMFIDVIWIGYFSMNAKEHAPSDNFKSIFSLLFSTFLYVVFLTSPYAIEFLLYFVIPNRLGVLIVAYLFASIQHPEHVLQKEHPFQATRIFRDTPLTHLLMLGQSRHLMHHLFPSVPYYRYHKAWEYSKDILENEALVWDDLHKFKRQDPKLSPKEIEVSIEKIEPVGDGILSFTFKSTNENTLPQFKAGAHIDVHIDENTVRQYSLTGLAPEGLYNIAVKKEENGRGGSKAMHEKLKIGDKITISAPKNLFSLQKHNQKAFLYTGGIGITPIISMAEELQKKGILFQFMAFARSETLLPFHDYLQNASYKDKLQTALGERLIQEEDIPTWQSGFQLYMCGPAPFMNAVEKIAMAKGWSKTNIHKEAFAQDLDESENEAFDVILARSGKKLHVPKDKSLLTVLNEHRIPIPASCLSGLCGTCECKVTKGEVDHRDQLYNDQEHQEGKIATCVSRAKNSEITLDL